MENLIQNINELLQKRAKVVADQKAIAAQAKKDGRLPSEWTTDERSAYNNAEKDFKKLNEDIRVLEELRSNEEQIAIKQYHTTTTTGQDVRYVLSDDSKVDNKEEYRKTFNKYIRFGTGSLNHEERKVLRKHYAPDEKRAQTVTTTGGGYAIPEGFAGTVEQIMLHFGPMFDPGVTGSLNTSNGNTIQYPTLDDTSNTGRLLSINTAVTTTDLTFGRVTFDAYKYSSDQILVPVELFQDEEVDLNGVIANALGERLGRIINTHLTTGTGSSQPNGVVTASAAGKTATAQTAFTRDEIIDLVHSVDRAYRVGPQVRFMMSDLVLAEIKKLTIGSGDDSPLWQPSIRVGEPDTLEGYRIAINNDMASSVVASAKVMLFGDFSKYIVRRAGSIRMRRLEERYADSDQVGFFGFMRLDGDLLTSNALKHLIMAA